MTAAEGTILLAVCRDFLVPGKEEPLELADPGMCAIASAIELIASIGELEAGLEEALLLAYSVEGQGDSPGAARALRRAIAESSLARDALGLDSKDAERALRSRGRRIAKRKLERTHRSADRPDFSSVLRIDPR